MQIWEHNISTQNKTILLQKVKGQGFELKLLVVQSGWEMKHVFCDWIQQIYMGKVTFKTQICCLHLMIEFNMDLMIRLSERKVTFIFGISLQKLL